MKTINLKQIFALVIAGVLSTFYVHSQTALSGTGSNTCTAGNAGTDNTFVGCLAGQDIQAGGNYNTALGENALKDVTTGDANVSIGYNSGTVSTTAGYNTFVGYSSGVANTSGEYNVFLGYNSGLTNATGASCTFLGAGAGYSANACSFNVFSGYQSGYSNTSGSGNSFHGAGSGFYNSTGTGNTYSGYFAGENNATGGYNTISGYEAGKGVLSNNYTNNALFGYRAGYGISTGDNLTFIGYNAGYSNTSADYNVFLGNSSGYSNSTGQYNVFVGMNAGYDNTTAQYGTFVGHNSGVNNTAGLNAFLGYSSGSTNTTGDENTFIGAQAGNNNSTGERCAFVGINAGYNNTSSYNTILGAYAGDTRTTCSSSTFIGYLADATGNYSNCAAIGANASTTAQDRMYLGDANALLYCALGVWSGSDERFKINVNENVSGLDFIKRLRPVTYQMDTRALDAHIHASDGEVADSLGQEQSGYPRDFTTASSVIRSGFLAQEVEAALAASGYACDIVHAPENETDHYALNYGEFVVPLVKAVQEQQAQIEEQQAQLAEMRELLSYCCTSGSNKMDDGDSQSDPEKITNVDLRHSDNVILYQNTPNPFGEETNISYYLPQFVSSAIIVFYDNMGKSIKEVVLEHRGNATLKINSSELASGIYAYSIIVDGTAVDSKKMLRNK